MVRVVEYTDKNDIPRLVLLPDEGDHRPQEGIPYSLNLDPLYPDAPPSFMARLYRELWAIGLVTVEDFHRLDMPHLFRAALLATLKHDGYSVSTFIKEN